MTIFDKYDLVDVDESFPIPTIPSDGLVFISGTSGSGKTTILRRVFGGNNIAFDDKPIYLNFSSPENAERLLIACGLRTIPAWRRSYSQLSTGEKHRAFCALSLDRGVPYIDEFTSTVDRDTAKALSFAMQKYFKQQSIKRLVIASCHSDIIEWLNPDHIYNADLRQWEDIVPRGHLHRPKIVLDIRACDGNRFWRFFQKHHYLSSKFNRSANSFIGCVNGKVVGFTSLLAFPCGTVQRAWREHRTVVLPEFQGIGIGTAMSEAIAQLVVDRGGRFFSKTSHPAFGEHRNKSPKWRPTSKNMKSRRDYLSTNKKPTKEDGHAFHHAHRVCYSHEYIGSPRIK